MPCEPEDDQTTNPPPSSSFSSGSDSKHKSILDVAAGDRYEVSIQSDDNKDGTESLDRTCPVVKSCSCKTEAMEVKMRLERTGRPLNLNITQDEGYVTFHFTDNSECENAYAFTRLDNQHEFHSNIDPVAVSFTNDYDFVALDACGTAVSPGRDASDDLSASKLTIGRIFSYCVRAVQVSIYDL